MYIIWKVPNSLMQSMSLLWAGLNFGDSIQPSHLSLYRLLGAYEPGVSSLCVQGLESTLKALKKSRVYSIKNRYRSPL
jgi:hypothetical protein